jgi:hypothetical protein
MAFGIGPFGQKDAGRRMMEAYEPKNGRGTADWFRILKMLPQTGSGMMPKSQRKQRLGGRDVARTRMRGLFSVMGIAPWG